MFKFFIPGLLILLSFKCLCQKQQTFFYSDVWKITSSENATYFRSSILDTTYLKFLGPVRDSYRNGATEMEGYYYAGLKHGYFKFFYEDGTLKKEGKYNRDLRDSIWNYYDNQGNIVTKIYFEKGDFSVIEHTGDDELVSEGNGNWSHTFNEHGSPVMLTISGSFQDGLKEGLWTMKDQYGNILFKEKFKGGVMTGGKYYNLAGQFHATYDQEIQNKFPDDKKFTTIEYFFISDSSMLDRYPFLIGKDIMSQDHVFTGVDVGAEYTGGMKQLYVMIANRLDYPIYARKNNIEGKVFISFIVSKYGFPHSFRVVKGIGGGCDEEALRVLGYMGKWNPGMKNGKPVAMKYVLPVIFNLTD